MDFHDFYQKLVDQMLRAPEDQIRTILISLCADKSIGLQAVARYTELLTKEETGTGNGKKRKASEDVMICSFCEKSFSHKENKQGACRYHTGKSFSCSDCQMLFN